MNPFEMPGAPLETRIRDLSRLRAQPYDKHETCPYTKTRVILMNGTEFEQCWFSHQLSRRTDDADLRRELSLLRRLEQQQQKLVSGLKPGDESPLEHTISYEQLAVDLTAGMARREEDAAVRQALDFALLEDFDHLYRYANLLDMRQGLKAEELVGRYTEIMPGRPTIAEHRHPFDDVRRAIDSASASTLTRLHVGIITAAEQQTMNYYMNIANLDPDPAARALYQEIGMIEEQHVTHYGSLMDPSATDLACLLERQYTECYLYWSCHETESDPRIRAIWAALFEDELCHLHKAAALLERYEHRHWQQVLPDARFPEPLSLHENIDYVRGVLRDSVTLSALHGGYVPVEQLRPDAPFFFWQENALPETADVESHAVIESHIARFRCDHRFETAPHPVAALQDRTHDNTTLARMPQPAHA